MMNGFSYEGSLCRPPTEAHSLVLQVTVGCPYNRCAFCADYKGELYKVKPWDVIASDIRKARESLGDGVKRVFLASGNSIAAPADLLLQTLGHLYQAFPYLEQVSIYGGAKFLKKKDDFTLLALQEAGLNKIYMGVESGNDQVLQEMKKGVTAAEILAQARRVKGVGMALSSTIIFGLGGKARSRQHATATAQLLSAMQPDELRLHTLMMHPKAPLYERIERGDFQLLYRGDVLREMHEFFSQLQASCHVISHRSNYLLLAGYLPEDRQDFLETIKQALTREGEEALEREGLLQEELSRVL